MVQSNSLLSVANMYPYIANVALLINKVIISISVGPSLYLPVLICLQITNIRNHIERFVLIVHDLKKIGSIEINVSFELCRL